jgi:hypothetical protein
MSKSTQKANKATTQTAAQAAAAIDARAGVRPEPTLADLIGGKAITKARSGDNALTGNVRFHAENAHLIPEFFDIVRPQTQLLCRGIAARMVDGVLACDADVLEDIDQMDIKPHAKSPDNPVVSHYAGALVGNVPWSKRINPTAWARFKKKHGLTSDYFAVFEVK